MWALPLFATGCGTSVLDVPAADVPVRPAPHTTTAVALGRTLTPVALELPQASRPGGVPAPEDFPLTAPFVFHSSRKHVDVWATPLPMNADLLPTQTRGTHSFGSAPPPDLVVAGPDGVREFERMGKTPGSWGFDR